MRAEKQKPGALAGATGSDFKAERLRDQHTTTDTEIQLTFYWSAGGSVERLELRGVAA